MRPSLKVGISATTRVVFAGLLLSAQPALAQTFDYQVLARPGSPAAVTPSISRARAVGIDSAGRVLVTADGGLLLSSLDGPTTVIVGPGHDAPGGGTFRAISSSSMNDAGDVVFTAAVQNAAGGIFRYSDGRLEAVLRAGAPTPWGGAFSGFEHASINRHGEIAFVGYAPTTGGPSRFGIYLYSNGSITELVQGNPSPGNNFRIFLAVQLNDRGQVAFASSYDVDEGVPLLHLLSEGALTFIASNAWNASLNNRGDIAFEAQGSTISLWSAGVTTVIANSLDEAFGLGSRPYLNLPSINDSRQISFSASIDGASASYMWEAGVIRRLALLSGGVYGRTTLQVTMSSRLNADGALAFTHEANGAVYVARMDQISRVMGPGDLVDTVPKFLSADTYGISGAGGAFFGTIFPGGRVLFDRHGTPRLWVGFIGPAGEMVTYIWNGAAASDGGVAATVLLSSGKTALWVVRGTEVTQVVDSADLSPLGRRFQSFNSLSVNAASDVVFSAFDGGSSAVYFVGQGQVTTIARTGDATPGGGLFQGFNGTSLNDTGDVAFTARDTLASRLWLWRDGQLVELARTGNGAPGGGTFSTFGSSGLSINNRGHVAFGASVSGALSGLFAFADGVLLRVAVEGQSVPGGTLGFPSSPLLDDQGDVVFQASIRNAQGQTTPFAVFVQTETGIGLVAGPGTLEAELGSAVSFETPQLVAPGQILFTGRSGGSSSVLMATRREDGGVGQPGSGDIGDVGLPGYSFGDGSTVVVRGSGADIWGTADAFHWRHTAVEGDFDAVALVTSVEHVHDWTKAGVMIRYNLAPGSPQMFLFATPTGINGVAFQRRLVANQTTVHTGGPLLAPPVRLKLSRRGNTISAWYLVGSQSWTLVGVEYVPDLPPSLLVGQAVTSHVAGVGATATFQFANVSSVIPVPLASVDVGQVGAAGSSSYELFALTRYFYLRGSGADIWGNEDAFHWAPTKYEGDFDAVVQVASVEQAHEWTKAGLMIRASADPAAPHMSVFATGNNGVAFQRRTAFGGLSTHTAGPASSAPVWLRLLRRGNTVSAFYRVSPLDAWTLIDVDSSDAFGPTVLVGLAVTSHVEGTRATALFIDLTVDTTGELVSTDVGNVVVPGRTDIVGTQTRLTNAGADIWGTADAFRYHATTLSRNGSITAQVLSLDPTDPWAKAGIMFRQSLEPDSPYVMLFVSAGQGISLQYRVVNGAPSAQALNVPGVAPTWLRIVRLSDLFWAYHSHDGVVWSWLGSVPVARLGAQAHVGLALTSHNESAESGAVFDNVTIQPIPGGPMGID